MSDDHNRGAYTPQTDAPLAFDARHSRGPGDRPPPLTLIVSGVILLVLVLGAIVFFVRSAGDGSGVVPNAGQSIDTLKTAPTDVPEAKAVDQQGLQIGYAEGTPLPEQSTPAGAAPTFAARPEAPAARPAPTTTTSAPVVAQPISPSPAAKASASMPTPKPAEAPRPVAKVEPKAVVTPAPRPSSGPSVQIGAFSSDAQAEQSWNGVASRVPGRIAGKTLRVEKAEVDGKIYHRALVGGFTSGADADSFCAALKAQGGDCSVRR